MKYIFILLTFCSLVGAAQKNKQAVKPKLVVGIVVDQMRPDYLARFATHFSKKGFAKLLDQGNECKNTFINYLPSYTGPGHTCIYTGSVPAFHGIASNDWYEKSNGKAMYCTSDSTVAAVGGSDKAGKMSPKNLWASTITDELRLASNFRSKVIAISLKDRASILPGGHTANAAYWMDDSLGNFMTSSYYMNELPTWVKTFNEKKLSAQYMSKDWNMLMPLNAYTMSTNDNNPYEGKFTGETTTAFPHKLSHLKKSDIKKTPFGNDIINDFAMSAIEAEQLGKGAETDFICISFSSTDYIGHSYGPNAMEIEDTYIRLDKNIEALLNYLDNQVGEGNYTLFLTADHGVAHNPQYLLDRKMPAGFFIAKTLKDTLNKTLNASYHLPNIVKDISENFIWLNDSVINFYKLNKQDITATILNEIKFTPEIQFAVDMQTIQQSAIPNMIRGMALNGYVQKRSGDILLLLNPAWLDAYSKTGTTHGTWNPYDTHIPLIWYGNGIKAGTVTREVFMTDIAATLATLLHIQMPNACIGKCIGEVIK